MYLIVNNNWNHSDDRDEMMNNRGRGGGSFRGRNNYGNNWKNNDELGENNQDQSHENFDRRRGGGYRNQRQRPDLYNNSENNN